MNINDNKEMIFVYFIIISLVSITILLLIINYVKSYFENRDAKMFIKFETHELRFFYQFDIDSRIDLNNL